MIDGNTVVGISPLPDKQLKIDKILDDLAMCESSNRNDVIILDSNNEYSYGRYQFQALTVKYYATKYNLLPDDLELVDYANWALDGDFSRLLARKVILDGGWRNWFNCLKDKDLSGL